MVLTPRRRKIDPLRYDVPIVYPDTGLPTEEFLRNWLSQRNVNVNTDATYADLQAAVAELQAQIANQIIAGVALDGGGSLVDGDVTIDHADSGVTPGTYGDATNVAQITVDAQGHVTDVTEVAISGGGGGGMSPYWATEPTPPVIADYTLGQASTNTTATDVSRGVRLTTAGGGATNRNAFMYAATPGSSWVCTVLGVANWSKRAFMGWGIAVRDNTTGRLECFQLGVVAATTGQVVLRHQRWTTYDSFNADVSVGNRTSAQYEDRPQWMRLERSGANYIFSISTDGEFFNPIYTVATGGWVSSIDQVGVWFGTFQNTLPQNVNESLLVMSQEIV